MKLWEEKLEPPEVCTDRAIQWWLEFTKTTNASREQESRLRNTPRWIVLPQRRLKMNIDGSWNAGRLVAGFGAISKDFNGCFVAATTGRFDDVSSPLIPEAMEVRADCSGTERSYSQFVYHWTSCRGLQSAAQHNH
ncbi:hypothetical protein TB1_025172 [Malus domestica]